MALFFGDCETKIDGKRRLAVNSQFRDQMDSETDGKDFIMILGPNRRLWLYPDRYYRRMLSSLKRSPLPTREQANMSLFFGMARELKPDSQGRIVVPQKLLDRSQTPDDVTVVANGDHLELWSTESWERHVDSNLEGYGEMLYEAADRLNAEEAEKSQE